MKTSSLFLHLCVLMVFFLAFSDAHAAWHYRYVRYNHRRAGRARLPQSTNQVNRATLAEPQEKPQKFKDLPLNTEFFYPADKERKLFPRVKISETAAKTVPTAGNPHVTTNPVPAETMVLVKKPAQSKGGDEAGAKINKAGKK